MWRRGGRERETEDRDERFAIHKQDSAPDPESPSRGQRAPRLPPLGRLCFRPVPPPGSPCWETVPPRVPHVPHRPE